MFNQKVPNFFYENEKWIYEMEKILRYPFAY